MYTLAAAVLLLAAAATTPAAAPAQGAPPAAAASGGASADVVLSRKGATWSLPATRVIPAGKTPGPCIAIFAGSGPTDRNWSSPLLPGGVGSAKLLAEALATKGVGSVRFDKVGSGTNMKPLDVLSLAHYVDEAKLAFEDLAAQPGCTKVFLLGHSEGSIHMTSAAVALQSNPKFGGLISMSGPSRSLLDTAIEQIRNIHARQGDDMKDVDAALAEFKKAMAKPDPNNPPELTLVPEAAQLWEVATDPRQQKVVQELMAADPLVPAKAYKGRALVLTAAHDVQVPKSDADKLFATLASPAADKKEVQIANANHVYRQETRDPAKSMPQELIAAYTDAKIPLAPGVADAIAAFVGAGAK
ncbi:MAG TPA: alpha/beta hydrolase [bacterium]|nr:alpha/beta hydrolase [bacterium]